ncbi:hypothetical protein [Mycobacterium sp.]|uniref:hypothetical protein n=1 Tax=Mycobacterium sp. TaxID=1785 RepID=UPI002C1C6583|nr:hypothetical protein [Mycobacterium sp.]HME47434.1 hypothetical protein [Mycobacterium sp.]
MSRIRNRFAAGAIVAAGVCSAALALSATASADPATPANPGLPGLNMIQQFANAPAPAITGLLQAAQSALTGVPPAPATPPAPPAATASVSLPLPQAPSAATTAPLTGIPGAASTTPMNLPSIPGLSQLSVPTNLAALVPSGLLPNLAAQPAAAAANSVETVPAGTASAGAQNPLAALLPFSALP